MVASVPHRALGADDRIRYPSRRNDAIRSVPAGGGQVQTISFGAHAYVTRAEGLPSGRLLVSMMSAGENQIVVREADRDPLLACAST